MIEPKLSKSEPTLSKIAFWLLTILLIITIGSVIILSSVPPVSRDALTHHLFIPKLYLQHGGIYEIPQIAFSYYPMNLDLLYTIPLYFGNDIIPKYIHFVFALLTLYLIYRYVKSRTNMVWGLIGALSFLTIPVIIKLSITVYVDLGLIFFSTAALLCLIAWLNNEFEIKYLIYSGLFAGLAAGTKYNGLITIIILCLFVPFFYSRYVGSRQTSQIKIAARGIGFGILFLGATFITYSPWLIRNYIWTDNPIYPLHNQVFVKKAEVQTPTIVAENTLEDRKPEKAGKTNIFIMRRMMYNESALDTLLLPLRFFLEGEDDNPRYFDGKLNPFLLILPLFSLIGLRRNAGDRRKNNELFIFFSYAFLYFFFVFFQTSMRVRYVAPSLPPLIILSTFGIYNIYGLLQNRWRKMQLLITALVVIIFLQPNFNYLVKQFSIVKPLSFILGEVDKENYITKYRPEYPAIQWLNARTTEDDTVLCIFLGNRGYYMDFFPAFASPYSNKFNNIAKRADHYVLIRDDLFQHWLDYTNQKGTKVDLPFTLKDPLFSSHGHTIYPILNKNNH